MNPYINPIQDILQQISDAEDSPEGYLSIEIVAFESRVKRIGAQFNKPIVYDDFLGLDYYMKQVKTKFSSLHKLLMKPVHFANEFNRRLEAARLKQNPETYVMETAAAAAAPTLKSAPKTAEKPTGKGGGNTGKK